MEITTGSDGRKVCPFDHTTPDFAKDYRSVFAKLHEEAPFAWTEAQGGFWVASSYEAVRQIGTDETYLVIQPNGIGIPARHHGITFVPGEADGEDHENYRLALNPKFSKDVVAGMRPMIEQRVNNALDDLLSRDEFDLMHDFLQPIVHGIASTHLGLRFEDPVQFIKDIMGGFRYARDRSYPSDEIRERFEAAWAAMVAVIEERRANPRDDVISHLIDWKDPVFTNDEIERMTLNVVLGAGDTTTVSTAVSFYYLDTHPEIRQYFVEHPDELEGSVDEFLRLISPTMFKGRTARADFEFQGAHVRAGERVMLSHWGANHDPEKFEDPHDFRLNRKGVRQHFAMSFGAHFCLGAWLAKAIMATALRGLLVRAPNMHVDIERAVIDDTVPDELVRWKTMPVRVNTGVRA